MSTQEAQKRIINLMIPLLTTQYSYALILVSSLLGLGLLDWRHKLALFDAPRATALTIMLSVCFFLSWDVVGIHLRIFSTNQEYVSGLHLLSRDLPLEEVGFLVLLSYVVLLCYNFFDRGRAKHV